MADLKQLALRELHLKLGAKMVPFAGYEMPVQYPMGVLKEHLHCRSAAGLFDVSHMGQAIVAAKSGQQDDAALALERLIPVDVLGLGEGRQRYGFLTNDAGGIIDDLMLTNRGDHIFVVVNAARKAVDLARLKSGLPDCDVGEAAGRALLALQGPAAEAALARLVPDAPDFAFMDHGIRNWQGVDIWISRSGYTGEDGFEISVPNTAAEAFATRLLEDPAVAPIGLGARDSLRLESGLCLYGHDMDEETSPIEASLAWAIQKARRAGGARAGGFPGASRILSELAEGPARKRVGLRPEGRAPMREGTPLYAAEAGGDPVGRITSGGFGPSLEAPIAMGYLPASLCAPGTTIWGELRGRRLPVTVAALPFRPATYKR
jgi:aminomethyltransferase